MARSNKSLEQRSSNENVSYQDIFFHIFRDTIKKADIPEIKEELKVAIN